MTQAQRIRLAQDRPLAMLESAGAIGPALIALGLDVPSPVLVLVGGASGLDAAVTPRLLSLFESLATWVDRHRLTLIDGGTAFGVMALMGQARWRTGARFPLLGVAAAGTVAVPGSADRGAALDPNHSHFLLVPGHRWGDESAWISDTATVLSQGQASLTLVVAGGEVTRLDATLNLQAGRPLVVIAGSGGTADALARWRRTGEPVPGMALNQAELDLIEVLDLDEAPRRLPDLMARAFAL